MNLYVDAATERSEKKSNWFFGDVKPRNTIICLLLCVAFTVHLAKIIIIIRKNKSWQQKKKNKIQHMNNEHWTCNKQRMAYVPCKCWKRQFINCQYRIDLVICLFVDVFSSSILWLDLKPIFWVDLSIAAIEFFSVNRFI